MAQEVQALDKALFVSFFTTVFLFKPEVTQHQRADPLFTTLLNHLRMGPMTGDDVQFLHIRVGAPPAAATTHSTAADVVQPATPQSPTTPALEPLPPMA